MLHYYLDTRRGAPWRDASAAWAGPVLAPDLPPGYYERSDVAVAAYRALLDAEWDEPPVVLGIGSSGYGAEVLALGGRAASLVLVDGLGPPWIDDPDEVMAQEYAWARARAAPSADAAGLSPRQARAFTERVRAEISVPVLALQSVESETPDAEVADRVATFGGSSAWGRLPDREPATVLATLVSRHDG